MHPIPRLILVIAAVGVAVYVGINRSPGEVSENERTEISSTIRQTLQSYLDAIRTGGLTAEFAYLDSSSDFFWVPPGYTSALTYDSVATILRSNAPGFSLMDYRWEKLKINPLHSTLAAYTGELHCISVDTAGNRSEYRMLETGTVIKRKAGWKILCGQSRIVEQ